MSYSSTSIESWTLRDFGSALQDSAEFRNYVRIPKFQRSLVWDYDQKVALIDSIYRGFPVGAILTYQTDEKFGNRNVLQVVDGLQRMSTIREYLDSPLNFVTPDAIFSASFVSEIANRIFNRDDEDSTNLVLNLLASWLREVRRPQQNLGWNFAALQQSISKGDVETAQKLEEIMDLVHDELTKAYELIVQMSATTIPVIVYSGAISNIPVIFERVNNQGIPLSKYEILASGWVNAQTVVKNPKIRQAVQDKYDVLLSQGYQIDGYNASEGISEDEYNLYEYLFGLGKVLSDKYKILFGASHKADEVVPLAFVLVTVAQRLKIAQMPELAHRLQGTSSGPVDPSALEAAIFESCARLEGALSPFLRLKLNKVGDGTIIPHSQNQILSLVSSYLANAFEFGTWTRRESIAADAIVKNAAAHYLHDIIRNSWRGSGDSRMYAMTWQDNGLPATNYAQPVSATQMREALLTWHEELLEKKQRERPNIPSSIKAALLFLYADKVSVFEDANVSFELEHIYPVSYLADRIQDSPERDEGWPISALGNIMIIPKQLNRIKSKNLLGDFVSPLVASGAITKHDLDKTQAYLVFPELTDVVHKEDFDKVAYVAFCRDRMKLLAEHLVETLKLVD